jgi:hypothetical protein
MTSESKKLAGDLLFWFQLLMAWVFTVPQVIRSFYSTAGMTITWSLFCTAFVLINLFLALGAWKQSNKSRKAAQIVLVYVNWLVLWLIMFIQVSIKGSWSMADSVLSALVIAFVAILLMVRRKESLVATISEPITRGMMSLIVKSVPQLFIGYCIVKAGSHDGLSGVTLTIGHITVCTRAVEIYLAARQDGWNRKNVGLFISETGNELTWLATTLIWLAY